MDSVDAVLSGDDRNNSASGECEKKSGSKRCHVDNGHGMGSGEGGKKKVNYNRTSLQYDMSGEKMMFIFNHHKFLYTDYFASQPDQRDGTEHDVARLQKTFGEIGFTVAKPCNDYTHQEILSELEQICTMDHQSTSCIVVVILTHGDGGGIVYAADMPYLLSNVVNRILHAPSLAGKPKLFLIQACRGGNTDPGHRLPVDGRAVFTIPTHSDYFVLRSSFETHVSFRTTSGSWMIQAFCDAVDEQKTDERMSILDLATLVNHKVAMNSSNSDVPKYDKKKQIPEVWFTLTKFLHLYSKN